MMSMGTREAVVAGRLSSRVADCNSLKPEFSENENAREFDKPPSRGSTSSIRSKQNLFSCFVASSAAAKKKKSPSSNTHHSGSWPRSPSHLMSRLLLSPDMNPVSPAAAGDHSPARSKSRFRRRQNNNRAAAQREYFSGPLLGGGGSSNNKKNELFEAAGAAKDEPTSPKVTCMGTVKAPKKHHKEEAVKAAAKRDSRPPKWRDSLKNFSGPLDLSRFGQNSGELAAPPSSKKQQQQQQKGNCVFGKSLLALQQQEEQKEWAAAAESRTTDWPASLKNLRIIVQKRDAAADEDGEFARWKKSLTSVVPDSSSKNNCLEKNSSAEKNEQQQPAMRKAEEICIWKRRCIAEPMKLNIIRH